MGYVRGANRAEVQLLPPSLEDYVPANAPVRFLEAFVEGLDFKVLGFNRTTPAATGRPLYHPADLLKLYLYGYLNRIRASRRLEAEAGRNLELMWLLRGLRPDFKTIADFRKDNLAAFKPLFKQFNLLCRKLGLFGAELVAIDGSKFKALNSPQRHYTREQLAELLARLDSRIDQYLKDLDDQDQAAQGVGSVPSSQELQQKIEQLKKRQGRYQQLLGELDQTQQQELSLSDPESRMMKGRHAHLVGYNVQAAVDAKHHLIVAQEVVQSASDRGQLSGMALAAQEQLGVESLGAVADKGYHEADQLEACQQAGIQTFVPEQGTTSGRGKNGTQVFPKSAFRYEAATDCYTCPAGQVLEPKASSRSRGKPRTLYYNPAACQGCALKSQCTTGAARRIARRPNEAVVEEQARRLAAHPEKMGQRRATVEHVFGNLRNWGHDRFLLKGLEKVRAEFSLSALTYNLHRVLQLVSLNQLLASVGVQPTEQAVAA